MSSGGYKELIELCLAIKKSPPTINLPMAKHPLHPCCNGKEKPRLKREKPRLKRGSLNVNPILGEYDAIDDAIAMVIHKDEVDNGEGVHHMEAQSNASILSVIHTYDLRTLAVNSRCIKIVHGNIGLRTNGVGHGPCVLSELATT